jgi:hypothetical protein
MASAIACSRTPGGCFPTLVLLLRPLFGWSRFGQATALQSRGQGAASGGYCEFVD